MNKHDGMHYAPTSKPQPVVKPGEFIIAAAALDHGHIYGMCNGLTEAGATLKWVYDPDPAKVARFLQQFPQAQVADSLETILNDATIDLVASAAIPSERCPLGLKVMAAGKDYFTDKAPLTTLEQLEDAKAMVAKTGRKYAVYYSERLHVESAVFAGELIRQGAIGRVIQTLGTGPHREGSDRPDWFYERRYFGGILCDIGSHQIEQFLFYTGNSDAHIVASQVRNVNHPQYPQFEDFGDAMLAGDNGATGYFRCDWFTPGGLSTWGDGRLTLLGTEGYIEIRKYVDLTRGEQDVVYLVNKEGEFRYPVAGKVGFPYFGQLILDCIQRTENAMTQEHAFKAAELCVKAQMQANASA
ncbi:MULTISPECIES: Gfo/Idh/MocA family protein [Citrobacter]|jgi:predicted dehydrogenase|uniref:Gfo/Idh/MocA family protein n=1 Tax=Citrobacter TaxID=544 RepID=UPI00076B430A|nr:MULTISPECIES: Gfo/Idh/MocA family oxidoreductase [Citrobacter]HAT6801713.1 Gfo/Idh/MocA family oxidoreductase [Citrobacter freundii]AMG92006.1 gfo/Idh/MocA family oxidoreductase [Citrobacter amalonaticus]AUO67345.1 oxidoreductase [Citrobacter freundii complex sp. CFNIH2]EKW2927630.1 Gfo/Idh/MocA family oxidoreductase [Citrobacter amalonaticus]MBJ9256713.1 Gfo/Idh/MocA family oxidoreductase [Citrobacter amalonaticus]